MKYKPKVYDIFLGTTCPVFTGREKVLCFSTLDKKIDYKKQVMFLLLRNIHSCYFLQLSSETWRRESNRATNLRPPPRLKMTDIKQNQQTTEKSKVYIILPAFPSLPPHPQGKNIACWERLKTWFFYRLEKNNTPHHPQTKKLPPPLKKPVQSSPVQSRVQSRYSIWPFDT